MISIRRAQDQDSQAIFEIHTRAIRKVCASHYSATQLEAWASHRQLGSHLSAIRSRYFLVASDGFRILGFGQLDLASGEMEAVYVNPDALRQGVGSLLLCSIESQARALGLSFLCLKSTLNAVPFYKHAGFWEVAPAIHRISSDMDLACIEMKKKLIDNTGS